MPRPASRNRRRRKQQDPHPVVHRTAWHPILADVLTYVLPDNRGYHVMAELPLNYQPLRPDYVIIVKDRLAQPASPVMAPLTRLLGPYNVVELTGPTSQLVAEDFRWLCVYAAMVAIKLKVADHREVYSFMVASRLSQEFKEEAERHRGTIHELEPGVHEVRGLDHATYFIETEVAGDHILQLLSPRYLKDPARLFSLLTEEEKVIFWMVYDRIEQFKKNEQAALKYPDWKDIAMTTQEFMDKALSRMSPDERLKGLPPEERLKGLSPEDIAKGLSPEARESLMKLLQQRG